MMCNDRDIQSRNLTFFFVGLMLIAVSHLYFAHQDGLSHQEHHCVFCLQTITESVPVAFNPKPAGAVMSIIFFARNEENPVINKKNGSIFLRGPPDIQNNKYRLRLNKKI